VVAVVAVAVVVVAGRGDLQGTQSSDFLRPDGNEGIQKSLHWIPLILKLRHSTWKASILPQTTRCTAIMPYYIVYLEKSLII
jgi:hypothetical protein